MKKILYGMMAATMIFATSCENELELGAAGEEAMVSFTIATPDMGSRAYSDGYTATKLQYAVYDAEGNILGDLTKTDVTINGSTTVNLQLTTGNSYSVIFWADNENAPYTVNFANELEDASMTVDYNGVKSNNEELDAFYAVKTINVTGAQTETVYLKRPFAQLNIGTNDYEASDEAGYVPTMSSVKVTKIYNTLNFKTGIASGEEEVTFGEANIDKGEIFPVTGGYEYIAMNYILVNEQDKELVDVEFTYTDGTNAKTRKVGSVPVQRNHRTNIYGQLLTSDVDINIEIKPDFDGEENVDIWDGVTIKEPAFDATTKTYEINYASELAYIAQLVNGTLDTDNVSRAAVAANSLKGCTVKLMTSINLYNHEWTPIGNGKNHFQGTFDGNGKSISGLKITKRNDTRAALFGTVSGTVAFRNLTIKGASIVCPDFNDDFYGSALIGTAYGVVTIENVDVVDSYISGNNKVGALLAHDGVMNTLTVSGCDVLGTTFEALNTADGGSVGGLVGYFQTGGEHQISDISVKGCTFKVVNSTNTGKRANGLLFGGIDSKAGQKLYINNYEIDNNTWNEKFYVDGVEVTDNKFVSPYNGLIGGERDDNAKGELYIDGQSFVTTTEQLEAALSAGATVKVGSGEFNLKSFPAGATIIGSGNSTVLKAESIITVNGAVNIENARVVMSNEGYKGFQGNPDLNFKNCTIEGQPFLYGAKATFEGCTFEQSVKDNYNVWVYAVLEANFIDCVFNCDGRSVLIYQEGSELVQNVTFEGCTFNAATPANAGKAAIEIGASNLTTGLYTVTINDCEANGFDNGSISGNTLWNVKNGNRASVTVDGEIAFIAGAEFVSNGLFKQGTVYSVTNAEGLASINSAMVAKTAGVGITINLLSDIDFTGKTWTPVRSHIDWGSTMNMFNGNGHTISNLTINGQAMFTIFANGHDVVVKDVTFDNAKVTYNGINSAIIVGQTYNNLLLENVDVKNSAITGNYKVATLVGTVYNEGASTITATLKDCDVTETSVKSTQHDFCTAGMVSFVYADDNDKIEFENCTVSNVKLYGPNNGYTAHAAIYTEGSEVLFNEAEGVTVTNVTFENI